MSIKIVYNILNDNAPTAPSGVASKKGGGYV